MKFAKFLQSKASFQIAVECAFPVRVSLILSILDTWYIHSEILAIKAQVPNRSYSSPRENYSNGSTNGNHLHEALIRALQERIISLEKQLNEKQRTIKKILDGPSHHSHEHCVNNQPPPPMGMGQYQDRNATAEQKRLP